MSVPVRPDKCLAPTRLLPLGSTYRTNQVWHKYNKEPNVSQHEEEAEQSHHVGREPHGQDLDEGIPLDIHRIFISPLTRFAGDGL